MDPVAIIKTSYLNVSPAALVSVFEARSAFTISVLRIKVIPVTGKISNVTPIIFWFSSNVTLIIIHH